MQTETAPNTSLPGIIETAKQSVVTIKGNQYRMYRNLNTPGFLGTFFRHFYEYDPVESFATNLEGVGSGVVLDSEGLVLTNYHCVQNSDTLQVKTKSDQVYGAVIVGIDKESDLALLRVNTTDAMQPITFADSSKAVPTDEVFAVGAPEGLYQTVTKGIVSAVDRDITEGKKVIFEDMIQTDTPVNPGNSGGPLLNTKGEMIGLITLKYTYGESLGFAIPSNKIKSLIESLKTNQKSFGLFQKFKTRFGFVPQIRDINGKRELVVADLVYNGKADKAGIQENDVLLSFDHVQYEEGDALVEKGLEILEDQRIYVLIYRNGRSFFTYLESGA